MSILLYVFTSAFRNHISSALIEQTLQRTPYFVWNPESGIDHSWLDLNLEELPFLKPYLEKIREENLVVISHDLTMLRLIASAPTKAGITPVFYFVGGEPPAVLCHSSDLEDLPYIAHGADLASRVAARYFNQRRLPRRD